MTQTARGFSSAATSSAIENDACRALAGDLLGLLRRPVVDDDLVAVADEPADHVGAHPAETDEPDAHRDQASVGVEGGRERPLEGGQAGVRIRAEVDPQDRQVVRLDRGEVAGRLGVDELAEACTASRGSSRSAGWSAVSWRNQPIGAPPLWSWPVEWRKRGP